MPPINELLHRLMDTYGPPDLIVRETPGGAYIGYGHPVNSKVERQVLDQSKAQIILYDDIQQALGLLASRRGQHVFGRMDAAAKAGEAHRVMVEDLGIDIPLSSSVPVEPDPEPIPERVGESGVDSEDPPVKKKTTKKRATRRTSASK